MIAFFPETTPPPAGAPFWEQRRGGGICYEHAWSLERLLHVLDYRARAIGGQITFPGSHQAVRVALPEGAFLVDVGHGAPFFDPIPLGAHGRGAPWRPRVPV